jgi:hypothetical protein
LSENALKSTYGNVEFQNFPGEDPRTSRSKRREKKEREEWKREDGGGGRGWGSRKRRGESEWLQEREGMER